MTTIRISDRAIYVTLPAGETVHVPLAVSAHRLDPEQWPSLLPDELRNRLRAADEITLLLPASWFYLFVFEVSERRPTAAALSFALEAYIPLEIEQLTCDFQRLAPQRWLGAALETDWMLPRLRALGIEVARIAIALPFSENPDVTDAYWTAHVDAEHTVAILRQGGTLAAVRVLRHHHLDADPTEYARLAEWLRLLALDQALRISSEQAEWSQALGERLPQAEVASAADIEASLDLAKAALASPARSRSGRAALHRLGVAACIGLLLLSVGNVWREQQAAGELRQVAAWERTLLAEVLPGQFAGGAPGMRLAAELRRAKALTSPSQSGAQPARSTLETLDRLVSALPDAVRIDVQELRIEAGDITLRGRTTDHPAAERIGSALRQIDGLNCDPPRTDRQADGFVQFFLHARTDSTGSKQP